jgi:hypothetical protein
MFKRNVGILDRIARVTLGTVLLPTGGLLLGLFQANVVGVVAAALGTLWLVTGATGVCPLYVPLGISTLEKERELMAKCMSRMSTMMAPKMGKMMRSCGPGGVASASSMSGPQRTPAGEEKTQEGVPV